MSRHELQLAGKGKRFANKILDTLFALVWIGVVFALGGMVVSATIGLARFAEGVMENKATFYAAYVLLFLFSYWLYFFISESLTGRTLAKALTKTRVVTAERGPPTAGSIALRSLCRMIPFEQLSFLGGTSIGWHDKFSNTRVVVYSSVEDA